MVPQWGLEKWREAHAYIGQQLTEGKIQVSEDFTEGIEKHP